MESYDVFLIGNFVALPAFIDKFGSVIDGVQIIPYKWQSALQVSGQLGALIGVFIAGPLTSYIGYRWATITGLMLLNAFIFVFYFAESMPVIFAAQILEGLPWGIFIANAPAYCSEIVPIKLRAPATQMLQMFWAIGSIIVGGVTYYYNDRPDASAYRYVQVRLNHLFFQADHKYRIPIALQWMFPTPLAILMFLAPERLVLQPWRYILYTDSISPWWLIRKGRFEEAARSVERLGRKTQVNSSETVAMMRRVIELETSQKTPTYVELFKGTDLRRTMIVAGVYLAQNLTGNLIANQAVYFFKRKFQPR